MTYQQGKKDKVSTVFVFSAVYMVQTLAVLLLHYNKGFQKQDLKRRHKLGIRNEN